MKANIIRLGKRTDQPSAQMKKKQQVHKSNAPKVENKQINSKDGTSSKYEINANIYNGSRYKRISFFFFFGEFAFLKKSFIICLKMAYPPNQNTHRFSIISLRESGFKGLEDQSEINLIHFANRYRINGSNSIVW